jgi:hypothetical protein
LEWSGFNNSSLRPFEIWTGTVFKCSLYIPIFTFKRPTHVSYKEGSIHFSTGQESEDSTEVVTKGQFGQDGQELDTQVDVVILETGNAGKTKVFWAEIVQASKTQGCFKVVEV